jgi:hypothetical protein
MCCRQCRDCLRTGLVQALQAQLAPACSEPPDPLELVSTERRALSLGNQIAGYILQ